MNKEQIKQLARANGFNLKPQSDGVEDLNPYVYEFAAALAAEAGEIGYYNGFKDALVIEPPLPPPTGTSATVDLFAYRVEQASRYAANQYAERVKAGEV